MNEFLLLTLQHMGPLLLLPVDRGHSSTCPSSTMNVRDEDWWETVVLSEFTDQELLEKKRKEIWANDRLFKGLHKIFCIHHRPLHHLPPTSHVFFKHVQKKHI